jgi:hypothetical protein
MSTAAAVPPIHRLSEHVDGWERDDLGLEILRVTGHRHDHGSLRGYQQRDAPQRLAKQGSRADQRRELLGSIVSIETTGQRHEPAALPTSEDDCPEMSVLPVCRIRRGNGFVEREPQLEHAASLPVGSTAHEAADETDPGLAAGMRPADRRLGLQYPPWRLLEHPQRRGQARIRGDEIGRRGYEAGGARSRTTDTGALSSISPGRAGTCLTGDTMGRRSERGPGPTLAVPEVKSTTTSS